MNNMWRVLLSGVMELQDDPEYGVSWEPIMARGSVPGKISHHKPAVFGSSVVCYGGITECNEIYEFDSNKCSWSILKQQGDVPQPRDDHSLAQIDDKSFVIFGGFVAGGRVNECFIGTKVLDRIEWKLIAVNSPTAPCIRASHSCVHYNGKCYIFGGQDDDNNKLCDLWELDLASETFKLLEGADGGYQPHARSGHSANIHNGKMYVFGGILELTKELNEMFTYDFATGEFCTVGDCIHPGGEEEF